MKLFDENTGLLRLDEVVCTLDSFRQITGDNQITEEEIIAQHDRVVSLLRRVDSQLADADRDLVISAIAELAALYQLAMRKEAQ